MDMRNAPLSSNVEDHTGDWAALVEQMRRIPDLNIIPRTPTQRASRELDRLSAEKAKQINLLLAASANAGGLDYGMMEHKPFSLNPGILKAR